MPEVPDGAKEADTRAATMADMARTLDLPPDRLAARNLVVIRLRGGAR